MIDWKILLITTIFVFQKLKKMKFPSRSITSEIWMDVILPQTIQYRDLFLNCIRCQEWWNVCFSSFKFYFGNYFLLRKLNVALLSELMALQNIYCSELADRITGSSVYHYTDNMAVPNIVQVGLKKPHLQDIAEINFEACKKKEIELIVDWRSREHPLSNTRSLGLNLMTLPPLV